MYSPLDDHLLSPRKPRSILLRPLEICLRLFNLALALAALCLLAAAMYMWHRPATSPPPPSPPPSPPPDSPLGPDWRVAVAAAELHARPFVRRLLAAAQLRGTGPRALTAAAGVAAAAAGEPPQHTWFSAAVACFGVYTLFTALFGLVGVKRGSRHHLALYIVLLAGLILGEAGALLLLFTDNEWVGQLPGG
jgi:hypothetical protein